MSEGDTIHRLARRLEGALGGRRLVSASAPSAASPLRLRKERLAALRGATLAGAEARGKHLLLHFDDELALYCHLGMSGSWRLRREGERWGRAVGGAWVVLSAEGIEAAQFGGSRLALRTEAELRSDRRLAGLGPDPLAKGFTSELGLGALRATDQSRELGEALLDQRVIAGIGNVCKSEGCHAARLSPWRPLGELADEDLLRVIEATRALMREGLERGRRPRRIYRRAGAACPRCGAAIRLRGQGDANRTTYWCPGCQGPASGER